MRYLPLTPADRQSMLARIGVAAIDDLFVAVPKGKLLANSIPLPKAKGEMEVERELDWNVYSRYLDIAPGAELTVRVSFAGTLPEGVPYSLTLRSQPLALPDVVRVNARTTGGERLIGTHGLQHGVVTLPS